MKIYRYHRNTHEFLGESDAKKDPLDKNKYLIPKNATTKSAPNTSNNEVAVFKNDTWQKKKDFRGTEYWETDGTKVIISEIDVEMPSGKATIPPPTDFKIPFWDGSKWVETFVPVVSAQEIEDFKKEVDPIKIRSFLVKYLRL